MADLIPWISAHLGLSQKSIQATIDLLDQDNTVPFIARYRKEATGGLDDTILEFDPKKKEGNGFKFSPYSPAAFFAAIEKAVDLFQNAKTWKRLMANGMKADFPWDRSAQSYVELYRSVIERLSFESGKREDPE